MAAWQESQIESRGQRKAFIQNGGGRVERGACLFAGLAAYHPWLCQQHDGHWCISTLNVLQKPRSVR